MRVHALAALCLTVLTSSIGVARSADLAAALPADTIGYVRARNVPGLYKSFDRSGIKQQFLDLARNQPDLVAEVKAWDKVVAQVQALHVSYHYAHEYEHHNVGLLLAADVGRQVDPKEWLPAGLSATMKKIDAAGRATVYHVPSRFPSRCGVFFAGARDHLWVASDLLLLEGVLDAAANGRKRSLLDDPRYRTAVADLDVWDVLAYVSAPRLLASLEAMQKRRDRDEFNTAVELLALRDVDALAWGLDYKGQASRARILMNPDSDAYRLLARPPAPNTAAAHLPPSTYFFATVNVGDGAATWKQLDRYLSRRLLRTGALDSLDEYRDGLNEPKEDINIGVPEFAAAVEGDIGIFFSTDDPLDETGLLFSLKNRKDAEALMEKMGRSREFKNAERTTKKLGGVDVTILSKGTHQHVAWALLGDVLVLSPEPAVVEDCARAFGTGETLAGEKSTWNLGLILPKKSNALACWNPGRMLSAFEKLDRAPPDVRDWLEEVLVGATATVADGQIEIRLAQTKKGLLDGLWRALTAPFFLMR
ncbi:MAG: DUF3352 domain-containing protein [Planctomycetota bacterium]